MLTPRIGSLSGFVSFPASPEALADPEESALPDVPGVFAASDPQAAVKATRMMHRVIKMDFLFMICPGPPL